MTIGPRSQCVACVRYRSPFSPENTANLQGPFCAAFPTGIPDEVFGNERDHRRPIDGDHGIRFEAKAGDEFPAYAFS